MKRALFISDIHAGSNYSVAAPKSRTDYEGGTHGMNPIQKNILWPRWKEMCSSEPYDFVVVNGDLVDGINRKSGGLGVWTSIMDLQAEGAARLLNMIPLKKGGIIYIVGGTPYHVQDNPGVDQLVSHKINEMGGNAKYVGVEFILKCEGQKIHITHPCGGGFYYGAMLNREIVYSYLYEHTFTGMVRGHRHHFHFDSDGHRFAMMLPAWKCRDDYTAKFGLKYQSQIGWVDMTFDNGAWDYTPHLFSLKNEIKEVKI